MQFRDPDYAAPVGADETRQQVFQLDLLRFHGVAAGREFEPGLGKLADAPGDIGVRGGRVKRPQRLAVDDECDGDVIGAADAVK